MNRDEVERMAAENIADVFDNGPGLRYGRNTWIGAIRTIEGKEEVLVCGLGAMGVGTEWMPASDDYRSLEGYQRCKDGWLFSFWDGWTKKEEGKP